MFGSSFQRSRRYPLSVAYVELSVDVADGDGGNAGNALGVSTMMKSCEAKFMIVTGAAGSGKTTLLKWMAIRLARSDYSEMPGPLRQTVPLYVRLRDFSKNDIPSPNGLIAHLAPVLADDMPPSWVSYLLNTRRATLLLDGIDELSEKKQHNLYEWLRDVLIYCQGDVRVVISARPHVDLASFVNLTQMYGSTVQCSLASMGKSAIETFIENWHEAIADTCTQFEKDRLPQYREAILHAIGSKLELRRLAQSPILCAMLCALNREQNMVLPEHRVDLYEACIAMFLRRDAERHVDLYNYTAIDKRTAEYILGDVAYWMTRNEASEVESSDVIAQIELSCHVIAPGSQGVIEAQDVYRFLVERVGLLREPSAGKTDFPHKSFQEFFCAGAILEHNDLGFIISKAEESNWREVLVLTIGRARLKESEKLLEQLIKKSADAANDPALIMVMAEAYSLAKGRVGNEVRLQAQDMIRKIIPPKSIGDSERLANVGEIVIPYIGDSGLYHARPAAACARTLALIGTESAIRTLALKYADDRRATVRDELVRGVKYAADEILYLTTVYARVEVLTHSVQFDASLLMRSQHFSSIMELYILSVRVSAVNLSNARDVVMTNCELGPDVVFRQGGCLRLHSVAIVDRGATVRALQLLSLVHISIMNERMAAEQLLFVVDLAESQFNGALQIDLGSVHGIARVLGDEIAETLAYAVDRLSSGVNVYIRGSIEKWSDVVDDLLQSMSACSDTEVCVTKRPHLQLFSVVKVCANDAQI